MSRDQRDAATGLEAASGAREERQRRRRLEQALENAGRVQLDLDPERLRRLREDGTDHPAES